MNGHLLSTSAGNRWEGENGGGETREVKLERERKRERKKEREKVKSYEEDNYECCVELLKRKE